MGSAYDFNLLSDVFFGTSHRDNAYLSYLCEFTHYTPKDEKSWQLYTFPGFRLADKF